MISLDLDEVVNEMGLALVHGDGAYFIGSGISVPSGLPDWIGLIRKLSKPLGIDLTEQDELPRITQYCINADSGNRGPLVGRLKRELGKPAKQANPYHAAISRTNVTTLWTTNFDTLLESALAPSRLAVRASDADLTSGSQDFDIELLKIHGCIDRSSPRQLVFSQEDYEEFHSSRPALADRLRHDLIHRSLLFMGYSYRDPNIATVVVEARRLAEGATREHFLITKRERDSLARKRQELWLTDLKRSGIRSALIDKYSELTDALSRLALASRGKSVFVTGSHSDRPSIASEIGTLLAAEEDVVLLDGQSEGTGREASNAFGVECVRQHFDMRERIRYFPNPYTFNPSFSNDPALLGTLKLWRASLFRAAQVVIIFDGGMGTKAELEVAREMGCRIIPVPTSHVPTSALFQASSLLSDSTISKGLDKKYLSAAKAGKVEAINVIEALRFVFET